MPITSAAFAAVLRNQVEAIFAKGDQRWARQTASLLEGHALRLRAQFGGPSKYRIGTTNEAPVYAKLACTSPECRLVFDGTEGEKCPLCSAKTRLQ